MLVNAAGTSLHTGSGVAGALRRAGGGTLNEAAMGRWPVEFGGVAVTEAFETDAEYVVHAGAMPHYGDGLATSESIRTATRNAMEAADQRGCESTVIPALGCGVAGFDLAEREGLICEESERFDPASLEDVRFIAYSDDKFETVTTVAETVRNEDSG